MRDPGLSLRIQNPGRLVGIAACVILLCSLGCSKQKKMTAAVKQAFDRGDYAEVLVQCEHALRNDVRNGEVLFHYGAALLELSRDYEAIRRFHEAVALDGTMGAGAAVRLVAKGRLSAERGHIARASQRLKAAMDFNPAVELGALKFLVAAAYFGERQFAHAATIYGEAIAEHPDTSIAEQAMFNLAQCQIFMGDTTKATEMYRRQIELFPRGALEGQARWKLVNLIYAQAQTEFERGNYERVVEHVELILDSTDNVSFTQKVRFLAGEAYERLGDYESAYEEYKAIIDADRGASGRIVDRARRKIEAFRDSGLI